MSSVLMGQMMNMPLTVSSLEQSMAPVARTLIETTRCKPSTPSKPIRAPSKLLSFSTFR